ncbi:hypothetical protein LEP1GSC049_1506 [Leptospira kirschneri serovar Cynopteri str. 3522 CT]|nr:hypothetical protein LEP1GSC065_0201 [Leptospira kirschneri serovar Sokoine str. RM1]EPG49205.1 hypothetical protein LEP1GSC049_1506 [Leptospira kirschneri serovar Cynopteri str. 3522 CT]
MDSAFLRKFIQKTVLVSNSPLQSILKGEFLFKNYLKNDLILVKFAKNFAGMKHI